MAYICDILRTSLYFESLFGVLRIRTSRSLGIGLLLRGGRKERAGFVRADGTTGASRDVKRTDPKTGEIKPRIARGFNSIPVQET